MTQLEDLECIYCELHKDVYGVKARWYKASSIEQAQKDLDALEEAGKIIWAQEKLDEQARIVKFETRIQELIEMGATSRKDALRWLHDAHSTNGDDDFLCYHMGIPYGYFRQSA